MKTHTRGRARRSALSLRSIHRIVSIFTLMFMLTSLLAPIASQTAFAQDATPTGDQTIVVQAAEQPVAPVSEEPAAPVVEEPVAPVVEEPAAPVVEEPAAPVVEEPAAPVVEEPAAPVVEEPAAPVVEEPAAPAVDEPAAPAVEAPADTTSSVEAVVDPVEEVVADPSAATCAASNATVPSIASDLADYAPGSTVTLTGSGWVPGQTVDIFVDDDGVADAEMGAWSLFQKVDADQNGNIFFQFSLPGWVVADYSVVATGECTTATTTFTDGNINVAIASGGPRDVTYTRYGNNGNPNADCSAQAGTTGVVRNVGTSSTSVNSATINQSINLVVPTVTGMKVTWSSSVPNSGRLAWSNASGTSICVKGFGEGTETWTATYVATQASTTLTVAPASGIYGTSTTLTATLLSNGAGVAGKTVSFSFDGISVGTGTTNTNGVAFVTLTLTGINANTYTNKISASFAGDASYLTSGASNTLTVNQAPAMIALSNLTPAYDGTAKAATATTDPAGLSGVEITYSQNGVTVANPTNAGTYQVRAMLTNANYTAPDATGELIIAKAGQTISFAEITGKTYAGADLELGATASSGLAVSYNLGGTCSLVDGKVHFDGAGSCTVTASQEGNGNYNAAPSVERSFNIAKAGSALSWDNGSLTQTYNGAPRVAVATTTAQGESEIIVTYATTGENPETLSGAPTDAGTYSVTAKLVNDNYQALELTGTLVIEQATQSINFGELDPKTFGNEPFSVSATATSGLPVSFEMAGNCTIGEDNLVTIIGAGECTITASQAGDANYGAATSVDRSFNIAKADQTIAFDELDPKTFGNEPFAISATGGNSGNDVVFTASGSCSVSDDTVTITGAGSCTITANQAGNANYNAAPSVNRSFDIAKADQTITFAAIDPQTFGGADLELNATASSELPVSYGLEGSCSLVSGKLHFNGAGSCKVTASQEGSEDYNAAPSVEHSFQIAKGSAEITLGIPENAIYDKTAKPVTATTEPASLTGVVITYTDSANNVSTSAPVDAGTYQVRATLTHDDYTAPAATGTLVIGKADQTITFAPISSKTFGNPAPTFSVAPDATSGLAVTLSVADGSKCTVSGTTVTLTGAGSCTITASQAGDSNYNPASNVGRTFSIDKGTATLTISNTSQDWNGSAKSVTVTTTPAGLSGVTVTYNGSTDAPTKGGTYTVVASLDNPDYEGTATGTLTITSVIQIEGPFQPIDPMPTVNSAKSGSTIPVKFKIKVNGDYVTSSDGLIITLSTRTMNCNSSAIDATSEVPLEQTTTGSTSVRYDATSGNWIYNWKTNKVNADQCLVLNVRVSGTNATVAITQDVYIKLKK